MSPTDTNAIMRQIWLYSRVKSDLSQDTRRQNTTDCKLMRQNTRKLDNATKIGKRCDRTQRPVASIEKKKRKRREIQKNVIKLIVMKIISQLMRIVVGLDVIS